MFLDKITTKLKDMNVNSMWFEQDDTTYHVVRETIQLLQESFPVWGSLMSKVYVNKPTSTHALKEEIDEIRLQLCKSVMGNFNKTVSLCPILYSIHNVILYKTIKKNLITKLCFLSKLQPL